MASSPSVTTSRSVGPNNAALESHAAPVQTIDDLGGRIHRHAVDIIRAVHRHRSGSRYASRQRCAAGRRFDRHVARLHYRPDPALGRERAVARRRIRAGQPHENQAGCGHRLRETLRKRREARARRDESRARNESPCAALKRVPYPSKNAASFAGIEDRTGCSACIGHGADVAHVALVREIAGVDIHRDAVVEIPARLHAE